MPQIILSYSFPVKSKIYCPLRERRICNVCTRAARLWLFASYVVIFCCSPVGLWVPICEHDSPSCECCCLCAASKCSRQAALPKQLLTCDRIRLGCEPWVCGCCCTQRVGSSVSHLGSAAGAVPAPLRVP